MGNSLKIDPNSGEIQISGDGLDYETSKTYEVYIEAQDSDLQPLRSVLRLTIDVTDYNDNPPVPKSPLYNATVNLVTLNTAKNLHNIDRNLYMCLKPVKDVYKLLEASEYY